MTTTRLPADPCERLAMVEEALYGLASGKTRVQVRHGEYWIEYAAGSVTFLERERARLSAICTKRTGITIGRTITTNRPVRT